MAVLTEVSVDWEQSPRVVLVSAPLTSISVQNLYDSLRSLEDDPLNMNRKQIISAGGKEALSAGQSVGITATLLNAVLKFADRGSSTQCNIEGGNLVAVDADGLSISPTAYSANVNVVLAQSSSATLNDVALVERLQFLIASQDKTHSPFGDVYFWDPSAGDDTNNGITRATAVKTFSRAHDLCSGTTRDTVFLIGHAGAPTTVVTESIVITKNYVLLHSSGRGILMRPTDDSADTISIQSYGVEVDSLRVNSGPGPTARRAVHVASSAGHAKLSNLYIDVEDAGTDYLTGDAIAIDGGSHHIIEACWLEGGTGDGICINNAKSVRIDSCKIYNMGGDGIHLQSSLGLAATDHVTLNDNVLQDNTGWDINIDPNVSRTAIRFLNELSDSSIQDSSNSTQYDRRNFLGFLHYENRIWIDTDNGTAGTRINTHGTKDNPCLNLADATALATALNFNTIHVVNGSITLAQPYPNFVFEGDVQCAQSTLDVNGQDVSNTSFSYLDLLGDAAGNIVTINGGRLEGMNNFHGSVFGSVLAHATPIKLAIGDTTFYDCKSGISGVGDSPGIDAVGAGRTFSLRAYSGGLKVVNMVDATNKATVEFIAGRVVLGATNTAGDISVRGIGELDETLNGGTSVDKKSLVNQVDLAHAGISLVQSWTRATSGGSKLLASVSLSQDGELIVLPGTATLDITVRNAADTIVISQTGIAPTASGVFSVTEDPYTPAAGQVLVSFAKITNGLDVYNAVTDLAIPEF